MTRKRQPNVVQPSLPYDRALAAFKRQLAELEKFKRCLITEVHAQEATWENFTQSLVEKTFGNQSSNLNKFYAAKHAGFHSIGGVSTSQRQENFERRIEAQEALLRSIIAELELSLPTEDIKGVYAPGEEYELYRDLVHLIEIARHVIFIADPYIDEGMFNLFVSKVQPGTSVQVLTNSLRTNVETVARMYATSKRLLLRVSNSFHDRAVFVDDRGWVIGQSVKDAATKKPTYIIELEEPALSALRDLHERIWISATSII